MKFSEKYIVIITILFSYSLIAQEILTKKEALKIALENNYGIKIANNNNKVAKNNSSIYNSNYLPQVSVTSGANYRRENQSITRQGSAPEDINGAVTKSYNASLNLNYTIFDGLGRKYNYKQLKERYNLSELETRETIENTYLQLFSVYFQIARLSENTANLQEALKISKERLKRATYQYEYGQSTKLALLNATVDVNNDSIAYINSKQQFTNSKRSLNIILGIQKELNYNVDTQVNFSELLNLNDLLSEAKKKNVLLQKNEKNIAINEFNIKMSKAGYLPKVNLTSSYGWNKSENPATSFLAAATSKGLNAGVNLSWNLFDGGSTKTRVANAKIALDSQEVLYQQQEETLANNLKNAWGDYQNKLFVLKAQEQNVITNQNNFDRTNERFKLGQVTSIEFRQAQINLINTKTALNDAKFDAKLIELELLQLSGKLLDVSF